MSDASASKVIAAGALWPQPWTGPPSWGGTIQVSNGRIAAVEATPAAGDKLIVPGLINAHDHGRGLRPLAFGAPDGPLEAWLWDLWRAPLSDPYLTALVAFGHMALSGVTTVVHNHLPQSTDLVGEAKAVAQAARDVGVRLAFVVPILDRNLAGYDDGAAIEAAVGREDWLSLRAAQEQLPFAEQIAMVEVIADAIDGEKVITQYGPPGPQWLSEAGLAAVGAASEKDGRRVHVHLLETKLQRDWMDANYPEGAHSCFAQAGLLNDRLTIAHGVFLRPHEIETFAEAGATLVLNTSSNLRLASGIADGAALAATPLTLGLGLDGMALDDDADMFRELRLAMSLLAPKRFDQSGLSRQALLCAAYSDGRIAYDGKRAAGLRVGEDADFVTLSLDQFAGDRIDDDPETLASLVLGRASRTSVVDVMVAGRAIVADGQLTGVDLVAAERELTAAARGARAQNPPPQWIDKARDARVVASMSGGSPNA